MKSLILFAGAVALGVAAPAVAKPANAHGHADVARGCPPGLAKKNNGCRAPGQARKLGRGQRYQSGYGTLYTYQRIPADVRRRYHLSTRYRYYYSGGTIYVVDPRTMLIAQVISAVLH